MVVKDFTSVVLPAGAIIRHIEAQERFSFNERGESVLMVWAEIDPKETRTEEVNFRILGTGHDFWDWDATPTRTYFKTVIAGSLVWHIYQLAP